VYSLTNKKNEKAFAFRVTFSISLCNDSVAGLCHIPIRDDKLSISSIPDDCNERINAFRPEPGTGKKI